MRRESVYRTDAQTQSPSESSVALIETAHSQSQELAPAWLSQVTAAHAIKSDAHFALQRVTTADNQSYLVKFSVGADDTLLRHEHAVFERLRSAHTLCPLGQQQQREKLTVVYRDFASVPLSPGALLDAPPQALLTLMRALIAPLRAFHERGWLVCGFSPASFLFDASANRLLLADAPFARALGAPATHEHDAWTHSPYLGYAAPEIIGRAPLAVDHRADLYALGCVLYAVLSGSAPFEGHDPAELIQAHLAKRPAPLVERTRGVAPGVSRIIMRLLAKDVAQRPLSIADVENDLLRELSAATSSRVRARRLRREQLRLSRKLFGLESALHTLREKFTRTRARAEVLLIEGEAGVGKSSLLSRARKLLRHGHFCSGRFEHLGAVAPLSGWAGALRELALWHLTQSTHELVAFRAKLQDAIGEGVELVCALVPEWSAVAGITPNHADPTLDGGIERLALMIHGLLRCHAEPDKPLVLALDDLQWADASSLRILELVLAQPEQANLLVIGALRSADANSGVNAAVQQRLSSSAAELTLLPLAPWDAVLVQAFLVVSFGETLSDLEDFAQLLLARTRGNPFFVHEFLRSLIREGLLARAPDGDGWAWRAADVNRLLPVDSVVEFLTSKLRAVPPALEQILCTGSCLGRSFVLSELAQAAGVPLTDAAQQIEQAVVEGLIRCSSEIAGAEQSFYEFTHDRVLEACRSLMTSEQYMARSLEIGRALRAAPAHQLAGYFNVAASLISSPEERLRCAELNLRAARSIRASGAFSQALDHLQSGLGFLSSAAAPAGVSTWAEQCFSTHPELARALLEEAAEAALLNSRLELTYELCAVLLSRLVQPLERVRAYVIRIGGLSAEKRYPEAVDAGCEILRELGVVFPKRPRTVHAVLAFLRTKRRLFSRPLSELLVLPQSSQPEIRAASRIMQAMYSAAYFSHPNLYPLLVCRHIINALRYGHDDYSCVTYVGFALVLGAMRDIKRAGVAAELALKLSEGSRHRAKVLMGVQAFVMPWTAHLRDTLPGYEVAIAFGLRHGDFEYASHLLTLECMTKLHAGVPLPELKPELDQMRDKLITLSRTLRVAREVQSEIGTDLD
jgi:predicted ATPase